MDYNDVKTAVDQSNELTRLLGLHRDPLAGNGFGATALKTIDSIHNRLYAIEAAIFSDDVTDKRTVNDRLAKLEAAQAPAKREFQHNAFVPANMTADGRATFMGYSLGDDTAPQSVKDEWDATRPNGWREWTGPHACYSKWTGAHACYSKANAVITSSQAAWAIANATTAQSITGMAQQPSQQTEREIHKLRLDPETGDYRVESKAAAPEASEASCDELKTKMTPSDIQAFSATVFIQDFLQMVGLEYEVSNLIAFGDTLKLSGGIEKSEAVAKMKDAFSRINKSPDIYGSSTADFAAIREGLLNDQLKAANRKVAAQETLINTLNDEVMDLKDRLEDAGKFREKLTDELEATQERFATMMKANRDEVAQLKRRLEDRA